MVNTNITATREKLKSTRELRLRQWFAARAIPADEKSYLSSLMSGKASSFGERAARRLEETYGMPAHFLDTPAPDDSMPGGGNEDGADGMHIGRMAERQLPGDAKQPQQNALILAHVDLDEMAIITHYRGAMDMGKALIKTTAQTAKKRHLSR